MNMHRKGERAQKKNSLVATYLDYCDFYRPKYFILENVREFATMDNSEVLKTTINRLLNMGYQCTFWLMQVMLFLIFDLTFEVQAGQFGVPQARRRLILLASGPGLKLLQKPTPKHVFPTEVQDQKAPLPVSTKILNRVMLFSSLLRLTEANIMWERQMRLRTEQSQLGKASRILRGTQYSRHYIHV